MKSAPMAFSTMTLGKPIPDADLATIKQTTVHLRFSAFPNMQSVEQDLIIPFL